MLRVCPKCHSNLGSHENYFCNSCGIELPENLVVRDTSFKAITHVSSQNTDGPFWKPFVDFMLKQLSPLPVGVLALGGVSIVIFLYGVYLTLRKDVVVNPSPVQTQEIKVPKNQSIVEEDFELIEEYFAEFVPYSVDVFIETNDIDFIKDIFLTIDPYYKDLVEDIKPLVNSHAALYLSDLTTSPSTTLILEPKSLEEEVSYVDFDKYPWMSSEVHNEHLIVSSRVSNVVKSKSASEGLTKNIIHHPKYTIMNSSEINKGSTVILFLNSFGESFVKSIISKLDTEKYSELQQKVNDSSSNFVVM